jgi:hypothetical protein
MRDFVILKPDKKAFSKGRLPLAEVYKFNF